LPDNTITLAIEFFKEPFMDALAQYTNNLLPSPQVHDRQLEEDVAHAIRATGYFSLSLVDIQSENGVVYLRGRVGSYYHKQVAQTAAARVLGHRQLINQLQVESA